MVVSTPLKNMSQNGNLPPNRGENIFTVKKMQRVSKNNGIPKSSILVGFSITNHPFCKFPISSILPKAGLAQLGYTMSRSTLCIAASMHVGRCVCEVKQWTSEVWSSLIQIPWDSLMISTYLNRIDVRILSFSPFYSIGLIKWSQ